MAVPYAAGAGRLRDVIFVADGFGGVLDRVDDLFVAGATAEVGSEGLFDLRAARIGGAVDQGIGLDDDAGDAEAALDAAFSDESAGEDLLPKLAQPFGGGHRAAGDLLHRRDAREHRLIINVHSAAAARRLGRAAILGGDDAFVLPEIGQ